MAPSPMGMKAYEVWRQFQSEQAKRNPEKADAMWAELIVILVRVRMAAKEWDGPSKRARLPLYREGAIWDAVSEVDAEEVARIMQEYELRPEDLQLYLRAGACGSVPRENSAQVLRVTLPLKSRKQSAEIHC
jgi:hypothetical protein